MLADYAALSSDLIKKLEQGNRRSARISTLSSLARALNVSIGALLSDNALSELTGGPTRQAEVTRQEQPATQLGRATLLRDLITERHWQRFRTFEAQFRRAARELAERERDPGLAKLTVSSRQWERWYAGSVKTEPHPDACRVLEYMFGYPIQKLLESAPSEASRERQERSLSQIELLRQQVNDALSRGVMSDASLEQWEQAAIRYARATRDRPALVLVADLGHDIAELNHLLTQQRSASALRRLTRVIAQMSGLMCLAFCILDDRPAFRGWARTARLAGNEIGDTATLSWILAQEAHGHYYSGDVLEAIEVARHARDIVNAPCAGAALAAALEARAQATLGRKRESRNALARAEDTLLHLDGDTLIPSAFGYNEASFRFHEGNAYTNLHDIAPALRAQERALELCSPGNYTDWAMTRLDRAQCLTYAGRLKEGLEYATETITSLTVAQRQGIITLRARTIIEELPAGERKLPLARGLHELLTLAGEG